MKMLVLIFSCLCMCLGIVACDKSESLESLDSSENYSIYTNIAGREFLYLRDYAHANEDLVEYSVFNILIDTETRVQYISSGGNHQGLCILVDDKGNPILYEGEFKR